MQRAGDRDGPPQDAPGRPVEEQFYAGPAGEGGRRPDQLLDSGLVADRLLRVDRGTGQVDGGDATGNRDAAYPALAGHWLE